MGVKGRTRSIAEGDAKGALDTHHLGQHHHAAETAQPQPQCSGSNHIANASDATTVPTAPTKTAPLLRATTVPVRSARGTSAPRGHSGCGGGDQLDGNQLMWKLSP